MDKVLLKLFNITKDEVLEILNKNVPDFTMLNLDFKEKFLETHLILKDKNDLNEDKFQSIMSNITLALNDYIYAAGTDLSIYEIALNLIRLRGKKVVLFEQSSGGKLVSKFLSEDDAENNIKEAFVLSNEDSWINYFNIDPCTITNYGKVSSAITNEIVSNIFSMVLCDFVIVTIGQLTNNEDAGLSTIIPRGLNYIAVGEHNDVSVYKHIFNYDKRKDIMKATAKTACYYIIKKLKDTGILYENKII